MTEDLDILKEGGGAKYNSAIADLMAIRNLMNHASMYRRMRDVNGVNLWMDTLNALYMELVPYMSKKERADLKILRVSNPCDNPAIVNLIHRKLDRYEERLREIRAKKRLGLIAGEDAAEAILR